MQLVIAGADAWGGPELASAIDGLPAAVRAEWSGSATSTMPTARRSWPTPPCSRYPSRYEGFGFPPLEAMRFGVPVVSTSAGSLPEVLGDAALLVEPDDEEAFADALGRLLADDTLASGFRQRGAARASMYSWSACAQEMGAPLPPPR